MMNANALKAKMAFAGLSAKTLCQMCGIGLSAFYRKLTGASEFTQSEIARIAAALHLTHDEIYEIFFTEKVS